MPISVGDFGGTSKHSRFKPPQPPPAMEQLLANILGQAHSGNMGGSPYVFPNFSTNSFSPVPSSSSPINGTVPPQEVVPGHVFQKTGVSQQLSPVQEALAQLDALINQGMKMPTGPSENDLQQALDEAAAGLQKQYGAEIGALRSQNTGARQDVKEGSAAVQDMYGALAQSYNKMGRKQFKQGKHLSKQLQNMGKREGNIVTNQANDINSEAQKGAAALGLANLGSELTGNTAERAQKLSGAAVRQGTRAGRTVRQQAGNDRSFMQTSGQASRLEGTNRSADMYAQLQDYLQQNRSQIASLAGERAAAIAQAKAGIESSFADAQQSYTDSVAGNQQDLIDNKMELLKLALQIQADKRDNRKGSNTNDRLNEFYDMLPDQIAGPSKLLNKMDDSTVTQLYQSLSGTSPMRYGYTGHKQDNTNVPLVDNLANVQAFVRSKIGNDAWGGLSTAQRNALVSALLLQLKGLG